MIQDFNWAHNKIKLQRAIVALQIAKATNPSIEINEETIKAQYIKLAGLVLTEEEMATTQPIVVQQKPVIRRNVVKKSAR